MTSAPTTVLTLLLLACVLGSVCAGITPEECAGLGFVSSHCTTTNCGKLADLIGNPADELVKECKACCVSSAAASDDRKFDEAEVWVCPMRLERMPELKQFIDVSHKYPSVSVMFETGAQPEIRLLTDGGDKTTVAISGWKVGHIEEFLQQKLVNWKA